LIKQEEQDKEENPSKKMLGKVPKPDYNVLKTYSHSKKKLQKIDSIG